MDIKRFENFHIPLWLIKDTCWLMHWKTAAFIIMVPTIIIAFYVAYLSRKSFEIWINIAVVCWIIANSFWMTTEFLQIDATYKNFAIYPFGLGLICVLIFYFKENREHV